MAEFAKDLDEVGDIPEPDLSPRAETIYVLIARVSKEIGAIAKDRKTDSGASYKFRGIDDILDAIHGPLVDNGVTPVPMVMEKTHAVDSWMEGTRRRSQTVVTLTLGVDFYGPLGDFVHAEAAAEALDFGDKSMAKAESVAYRTIMIQTFSIPVTTGMPDLEDNNDDRQSPPTAEELELAAHKEARDKARAVLSNVFEDADKRAKFVGWVMQREVPALTALSTEELDKVRNVAELVATGAVTWGVTDQPADSDTVSEPAAEPAPEPAPAPVVLQTEIPPDNRTPEDLAYQAQQRERIANAGKAAVAEQVATPEAQATIAVGEELEFANALRDTIDGYGKPKLTEELAVLKLPTGGTMSAMRTRLHEAIMTVEYPKE